MSTKIFGTLVKDCQVKIKRSNGKVHDANVQNFNEENHTVHVEWFENEDIKGKELPVSTVFALNPEYKTQDMKEVKESSTSNVTTSNSDSNIGRKSIFIAKSQSRLKENKIPVRSKPQPQQAPTASSSSMEPPALPQSSAGAVQKGRKSEVVRNMEKIESDRVARRNEQKQARYQRDQIRSKHDVNDKQWEFAQMIAEWNDENDLQQRRSIPPDQKICVCVRKRPLNGKETRAKETDVISRDSNVCIVHQPQTKVDLTKYLEHQKFRFDYTFDSEDDNRKVYEVTARPLVQAVFDGAMATCFAYGQTGSGKTHTMGGEFSGKNQNCKTGIYALSAADVFNKLRRHPELRLEVSFFEIYSNKVFDLLNKKARLSVLEDKSGSIRVVNLSAEPVETVDDVIEVLAEGSKARTSGQTSANSNSSRSHAVFQLVLMKGKRMHGTFSLIDLAGNERGADTMQADRQTKLEGAAINKSLLCLKECIRAMGKDARHIPFRGSTLTKVLRDSFIGDRSKTCMIATISPGLSSCENTINTLRYADRVKGLAVADVYEDIMEESVEQEQSMEHSRDDIALDMLASANSDEFTPELVAISKAQSQVEQMEEKTLDYCDDWLEWMSTQIAEVQRLRAEAGQTVANSADYGPKLLDIFQTMSKEQEAISKQVGELNNRNQKLQELVESEEKKKKSTRHPTKLQAPSARRANSAKSGLY